MTDSLSPAEPLPDDHVGDYGGQGLLDRQQRRPSPAAWKEADFTFVVLGEGMFDAYGDVLGYQPRARGQPRRTACKESLRSRTPALTTPATTRRTRSVSDMSVHVEMPCPRGRALADTQ